MISVLSLPTNPEILTLEDCLLNSKLHYQVLPSDDQQITSFQQFGFLSVLSNKTEKRSYKMYYTGAEPSPPERQLIDVPKLIAEIKTKMDISVNYLVCPVFVMKIYGLVATTKP